MISARGEFGVDEDSATVEGVRVLADIGDPIVEFFCPHALQQILLWQVVLGDPISCLVQVLSEFLVLVLRVVPHGGALFGCDLESLWVQLVNHWVNSLGVF